MSATDQISRVTPYLERLLRDDYIQEQLGDAITGLRRSSQRAKGRGATEALKDRRLRDQLSAAAGVSHRSGACTQPTRATQAPLAQGRVAPRCRRRRRSPGLAANDTQLNPLRRSEHGPARHGRGQRPHL